MREIAVAHRHSSWTDIENTETDISEFEFHLVKYQ